MGVLSTHKKIKTVTGIMLVLAAIGLAIAWIYYGKINKAVDPRVKQARVMYGRYNFYASQGNEDAIISLLDSITGIYQALPHYQYSYEMGVIKNNRASIFLTKALKDSIPDEIRQLYFNRAEEYLLAGIGYYINWLDDIDNKSNQEIFQIVYDDFVSDAILVTHKNLNAIVRNRVNEILAAQTETPRRLSVSYTNLGIVMRHQNFIDEAVACYLQALELWEENLTAKNNLNILLGRPLEKRSFIEKMFPPKRK